MNTLTAPTNQTNKTSASRFKSFRFELSLKDCESSECPEFSYTELVKNKTKEKQSGLIKGANADDNQAKSMASYFEKKYGGKKRKRDRLQDMTDVGYGYDETDPFVDNSECYDELIPSSMTTQFGGFYINSGKLEFKQVSDDSNMDDDDDILPLSAHRKSKKYFSSDDDSLDSPQTNPVKKQKTSIEKRRKLSFQGKEKLGKLSKTSKKKQTKVQLLVAKAKKAQQHMNAGEKFVKSHARKHTKTLNGSLHSKESRPLDPSDLSSNSLRDGYQSSSSDDVSLAQLSSSQDRLPQSIPNNIKEKISSLTKIAKSNEGEGKVKFFSPDVNHLLLGIEVGSQSLSNRERSGIYQHLTPHMPCSKDTLIRRMKKLRASKEDESLRSPLNKLKLAVDEVMLDQTRRYDEECTAQQLAKQDERNPLAASTDEDDDTGASLPPSGEEKAKRTYAPRRKFQWNDNLRSLLCDVIKVKVGQYETCRNKQSLSAEDYIKNFLESEVKPLWPKGWMQTRTLFKEGRDAHRTLTGATSKIKKGASLSGKKLGPTKNDKKTPSSGSSHEASLSVNIQLESNKQSLIKQAQMLNQAIITAQKELSQPKHRANKTVTPANADTSRYAKLSTSLLECVSGPAKRVSGGRNEPSRSFELKRDPATSKESGLTGGLNICHNATSSQSNSNQKPTHHSTAPDHPSLVPIQSSPQQPEYFPPNSSFKQSSSKPFPPTKQVVSHNFSHKQTSDDFSTKQSSLSRSPDRNLDPSQKSSLTHSKLPHNSKQYFNSKQAQIINFKQPSLKPSKDSIKSFPQKPIPSNQNQSNTSRSLSSTRVRLTTNHLPNQPIASTLSSKQQVAISHPPQHQKTANHLAKQQVATSHPPQHQKTANHLAKQQVATSHASQQQKTANHLAKQQVATGHASQHQKTTRHTPQHQKITSHKPQHQETTSHTPQHQKNTSHTPQHQKTTSHRSQIQKTTSHRPQHQETTSHTLQRQETTSHTPQHQKTTSHRPQHQKTTSHTPQHQKTANHLGKQQVATSRTSQRQLNTSPSEKHKQINQFALDSFGADLLKLALIPPPGATSFLPTNIGFPPGEQSLDDLAKFMKLHQASLQYEPFQTRPPSKDQSSARPTSQTKPQRGKSPFDMPAKHLNDPKYSNRQMKSDTFQPIPSPSYHFSPPPVSQLSQQPLASIPPPTSTAYNFLSTNSNSFFPSLLAASQSSDTSSTSLPVYNPAYVNMGGAFPSADQKPISKDVVDSAAIEAYLTGKRN